MTKQEQNQIIKDAWVRNLQKEDNIPDDISDIYKNWVLSKIQQASAQLQQPAQQDETQENNEEQQKEAS